MPGLTGSRSSQIFTVVNGYLYDELTMPPELRKAHQANDRAVMQAYGMSIKETDEAACVAWLMRLYQEKVAELEK